MSYEGKTDLDPILFDKNFVMEVDGMQASLFRYDSGVAAVRIENARGEIILTPFQGMQIWSAEFDGVNIGMDSLVKEPKLTQNYLGGYGALLVHCGATKMGCPGPKDEPYPLHGDLPYADYSLAQLLFGENSNGTYMAITGNLSDLRTRVEGNFYNAFPMAKLYWDSSMIDMSMKITNPNPNPMDLMYLAHINLANIPGSELVYSAPCTPEDVRVRVADPGQSSNLSPEFIAFRQSIIDNPALQDKMPEGFPFDPEVVSFFKYLADPEGWAHSMSVLPDGNALYVQHNPVQFPIGVRWIRTVEDPSLCNPVFPVRRSLGYLPSTSGVEGYAVEKERGTVRSITSHGEMIFNYRFGLLVPDEVATMRQTIDDVLRNKE